MRYSGTELLDGLQQLAEAQLVATPEAMTIYKAKGLAL
jgi:hypothetical protein